jgi:hypothetical protein
MFNISHQTSLNKNFPLFLLIRFILIFDFVISLTIIYVKVSWSVCLSLDWRITRLGIRALNTCWIYYICRIWRYPMIWIWCQPLKFRQSHWHTETDPHSHIITQLICDGLLMILSSFHRIVLRTTTLNILGLRGIFLLLLLSHIKI